MLKQDVDVRCLKIPFLKTENLVRTQVLKPN